MKTKIILVVLFIIILIILFKVSTGKRTYVKSYIDDEYYLVRDLPDKQKASNMLAKLKKNITKITMLLNEKKNTDYKEFKEYIDRLSQGIVSVVISETPESSSYTSYSVNKGEELVFCLRSKYDKNIMHDINLLMYVTLHEISHIACPEYGHTPLFKKIFAFITKVAIENEIYQKINFPSDPTEYCGLVITESII